MAERDAIDREREIFGYYEQKNISRKNLKRLGVLSNSSDPGIAALAEAVLAVGKVKPHRRKRLGFLARHHPEVMEKLGAVGLIILPGVRGSTWPAEHDFDWQERDPDFPRQVADEWPLADDDPMDPGEIGRLLLEYLEVENVE